MYIDRGVIYSEPYKYLICNNVVSYSFPEGSDVTELDVNMDDMKKYGQLVCYNNGKLAELVFDSADYGTYKSAIIKKRYSNDDQIAIMLNKEDSDEDLLRYERMMKWREFAASLSKELMKFVS